METVNLVKGERLDLTKTNPGLKVAAIGLGWDPQSNGHPFDLDSFALALEGGKLKGNLPDNILYFGSPKVNGQPTQLAGALVHSGDNLTGQGAGDDETILVDFSKLPSNITEVVICVNIYQAASRGNQNFGMVNNAFIRVYDNDTKTDILKYDLTEDYSAVNGMVMGKLYLKDGEWKFQAVGTGLNGDINQIAQTFV